MWELQPLQELEQTDPELVQKAMKIRGQLPFICNRFLNLIKVVNND